MWLEATVWIWAPLVCAAVLSTAWFIVALRREVRGLRVRVIQLELAGGDSSGRAKIIEPRRTAA
jgi:hypothetical protein